MIRDERTRAPGHDVGITETMIRDLVDEFYTRVRADAVLGPIFNSAIDDWGTHLDKMYAFWSSVMLMSGRYKGNPMKAHAQLPQIRAEHFPQWLSLFRVAAAKVCPPAASSLFVDRAERIAATLQMGIAIHRSSPPDAGAANRTASLLR